MGDAKQLIKQFKESRSLLLLVVVVVGLTFLTGIGVGMSIDRGQKEVEGQGLIQLSQSGDLGEEEAVDEVVDEVCVEVAGAVMSPGVFCLPDGSRVVDALARAGEFNYEGYAYKYVSRKISLARLLDPDEKIYIPFQDDVSCETVAFAYVDEEIEDSNDSYLGITEGKGSSMSGDGQDIEEEEGDDNSNDDQCISVNNASLEELMSIEGIGESTAQNIIDARPFESLEELLDVSGIGQSRYEILLEVACL